MTEFLDSRRPTDEGGGDAGHQTSSLERSTAAEATSGVAVLPFREVWVSRL